MFKTQTLLGLFCWAEVNVLAGSYFYLIHPALRHNRFTLRKLDLVGNTIANFSELLQCWNRKVRLTSDRGTQHILFKYQNFSTSRKEFLSSDPHQLQDTENKLSFNIIIITLERCILTISNANCKYSAATLERGNTTHTMHIKQQTPALHFPVQLSSFMLH